jgi:putative ATPase
MAAAQAVQFVGMPEASITLGQAVTYIASAPKSNRSCEAIGAALADAKNKDYGPVPPHLRDAHYKAAGKLGHGVDYLYPHNYPGNFVQQQYLPDKLIGTEYYHPTTNGREAEIAERLKNLRKK